MAELEAHPEWVAEAPTPRIFTSSLQQQLASVGDLESIKAGEENYRRWKNHLPPVVPAPVGGWEPKLAHLFPRR